jgi:hypothetical protein
MGRKSPTLAGLKYLISAVVAAGLFVEAPMAAVPGVSTDALLRQMSGDLLFVSSEASVTTAATNNAVQAINGIVSECKKYDPAYRTDCLAQGLKEVAARLPRGEYDKARSIISSAASKLNKLVSRNVDTSQDVIQSTPNSNPRLKTKRRYRAVKKEALAAVMKEAQGIVDEAVTELLRSYENSDKRHAHYQKIATAVGSTKVLLRS